ncbi:MAG: hypothetical protein JZU70_02495 [Chlorobium sp.]|jgi:hypothetical protein|nr:hypothetical protein [Chlorobium sp.]
MSINDLLPSVATLSHADKFRLVQIVLELLAKEEGLSAQQTSASAETFNPRSYYGAAHQSRQEIDEYIASSREGWN